MLQPRMFSSLARLIKKPQASIMTRKLHEAVNADAPLVLSVTSESALSTAAKLILSGKVIAIPTDTIYGIAVSAQNNNGIRSLYELKRRDMMKPVAICVGDVNEVELYGETSHLAENLLESLLPGPVTVVLRRKELLNLLLNPDTDLVGIRVPNFPFIRNLARACGVPLALTSANLSSQPSPLRISEFCHLWPSLGGVFDGGVLGNNRAGSTVIDLSEPGYFKIIRPGSDLERTLTTVKNFGLKERQLMVSTGN